MTLKLERPANHVEALDSPEAEAHLLSVCCCRSGWDPRNHIANKFRVMLTLLIGGSHSENLGWECVLQRRLPGFVSYLIFGQFV